MLRKESMPALCSQHASAPELSGLRYIDLPAQDRAARGNALQVAVEASALAQKLQRWCKRPAICTSGVTLGTRMPHAAPGCRAQMSSRVIAAAILSEPSCYKNAQMGLIRIHSENFQTTDCRSRRHTAMQLLFPRKDATASKEGNEDAAAIGGCPCRLQASWEMGPRSHLLRQLIMGEWTGIQAVWV